jgi:hypothetical protein
MPPANKSVPVEKLSCRASSHANARPRINTRKSAVRRGLGGRLRNGSTLTPPRPPASASELRRSAKSARPGDNADVATPPPEVLQWARETLRGIGLLTGAGRGYPSSGRRADLDPEVASFLYGIEAELARFLEDHKTTDPSAWVPPDYGLNAPERDVIRMALRGDIDLRRYVPEVMMICAKLDITEPPWFEDESVRKRVDLNRPAVAELRRSRDKA